MVTDTRRLTILSAEEIAALYVLPKFNDGDRRLYFDFSAVQRDAVERVHTYVIGGGAFGAADGLFKGQAAILCL